MLQVFSSTILLLLLLQLHSSVAQPNVMVTTSSARVSEGDTLTVNFTLSESPQLSDFVINLSPVQQGPGAGQFGPIEPSVLTFEQGTTDLARSVQIQVLIDDMFEQDKIAPTFVATPTYNGVTLPPLPSTDGQVFVEDFIYIGFQEASYTFLENTTNQVCVMISATIPDDSVFTANIAYSSNFAVVDVDYTVGETSVTFSSSTTNRTECVTLTILDDSDFEQTEALTASLSSSIINPEQSTATISIIDLDANCGSPPQSDGLTVTVEPYTQDARGNIVTNQDAVATYTCNDLDLILNGTSQLMCVLMNETDAAVWYPEEPPTCVEPEIIPTMIAMTAVQDTESPATTAATTTEDGSRGGTTDVTTDGAPPTLSGNILLSVIASVSCLLHFS